MEPIKVKGSYGCKGCKYENEDLCPADPNDGKLQFNLDVCMDTENHESLIFVDPNPKS